MERNLCACNYNDFLTFNNVTVYLSDSHDFTLEQIFVNIGASGFVFLSRFIVAKTGERLATYQCIYSNFKLKCFF